MSRRIVMGVDGGGTKSHLALFDADGKCITAVAGGCLNHEGLSGGFDELAKVIDSYVVGSLNKVGVNPGDVAYSSLGMAGVDTNEQHGIISDILKRAGFKDFFLCNDGYLAVAAGCPDGIGISATNGTGTSLAAVDHSGTLIQIGGVGDLSDDRGGGWWYGMKAIGAIYNSMYKLGKPTIMREMLFEIIGISRNEDYVDTLSDWQAKGKINTPEINRIPARAATQGDIAALEILEYSAEHYAGAIAYLATTLDFPAEKPLFVTLSGSAFIKEEIKLLPQIIEKRVSELLGSGRTPKYVYLQSPPVAGAVLWAAQKANCDISIETICSELESAYL